MNSAADYHIEKTSLPVIVGAGPGGAVAALQFAKAGQKCIVLEAGTFPRDKVCGDAFSGKVLEALNRVDRALCQRVRDQSVNLPAWGIRFVAPNRRVMDIPFKTDYDAATAESPGYVCKRAVFDTILASELIQSADIELRQGVKVKSVKPQNDGMLLTLSNGEQLHTPLLLAADGANSTLKRALQHTPIDRRSHSAGLRWYFKNVSGFHPDNFIELHFLKPSLPGYFWIFPLPNGEANVGIGMRSDVVAKRKVNLKQVLKEIIETDPLLKPRFANAEPIDGIRGLGLPLGSQKVALSGAHYMLLGDAGNLIDPFTGEGIGNAMLSGQYAAEVALDALKNNDLSADGLQDYDVRVYKRLWSELSLSRRLQGLLRYPWLFNLVVNRARKNPVLQQTITAMFEDVDLRAKFKDPVFYLKLLFG